MRWSTGCSSSRRTSVSTETHQISVSGVRVTVVRKDIKNLHLGVYPPNGRVRVAAPPSVSDEAVRLAVVGKLGWIRRQRARFEAQPRQSQREMVGGESHYFLGRRCRLQVHYHAGSPRAALRGKTVIDLFVRPGSSVEERERVLQRWYRAELKTLTPPLLEKWQRALGVQVAAWGVRRMKTRWGSCTIDAGRVWLNLELVKKPVRCLEYIVVHELMHLRERHHGEVFVELMDNALPSWRARRAELNRTPLAQETWEY